MLKKENDKHPIEVALEKNINKIGATIVWAIRTFVKFWFVIPKCKWERQYKMIETTGWFLIGLGWVLITLVRFHFFGW